ncbi:hypothetical protein CU048_07310 [Beijerinckiaceae bacterium]|nr:hypothetical protein CU048_07310 [Beijerinckiaceae bacterium]
MQDSIVGSIIAFVFENFSAILFALALICAAIDRRRPAAARILSWLLLLPIGLGGLWAGFFHIAYPDVAAKFIGWKDSPFQFEVGMADLAFGVAGCVAFRASYGFKAATVLVNAIFLLGDAIGHVHQMMAAGNFAPGNAGAVFYLDIILPVTTIILLLMSRGAR